METETQPPEETIESPKNDTSSGISPIMVIFLITALFGFVVAIAMLLADESNNDGVEVNTSVNTSPRVDREAPSFTTQTLEGQEVALEDYQGRIVFLNFWRTDCGPCIYELPAFQEFTQAQGEDGALILALNQGESADQINEFLDDIGITELTVLLDEDAQFDDLYNVGGLPTTFVIDETGVIRYFKLGAMSEAEMNGYIDLLTTGETEAQG